MPTLGELTALLDRWYPPAHADSWDAVGLVCGDPADDVHRVLLAVDPVLAVADEAVALGAQLVVTHHPLLLTGVHGVAATDPKGAVVHRLVRAGCGLLAAHTNADSPALGVSESLALALGLVDVRPLEADETAADEPDRGSGRVGRLPTPLTLRDFAGLVDRVLPATAHGVRVAGDPDQRVEHVGLCGGAGDFLLDRARARGGRRLPDLRPAPPPRLGAARARRARQRRARPGRRRALGRGEHLAAGAPAAAAGRAGRYGGGPPEHDPHRPVDVPGLSPPATPPATP